MPSCCIYGCSNRSHNHKGEKREDGLRFFCIPTAKVSHGEQAKAVSERRRRAWVAAIRRTTFTFEHCPTNAKVCGKHFHSGKPAYEMMETDPDWVPTLHLGHQEIKETNTTRHNRQKNRKLQKETIEKEKETSAENERPAAEEAALADVGVDLSDETESHERESDEEVDFQTDLPAHIQALTLENDKLREEIRRLKQYVDRKEMTLEYFKGDNDLVKYYTGLHSFSMLKTVHDFVKDDLPNGNRRALSPFQMLIISLMRLRLNLPIQHLAHLFGVHRTTITNAFYDTITALHTRLNWYIHWPDRESLHKSMPHQFVETFGKNVAVIIDCFEIFIEKPSNIHARSQTYSNYKSNHTMKYLIGITPKGIIYFISKGWGGRASDKKITENSGFLNNLLPGDKILADRGFDIEQSVGFMCAEVKIPAFTKGKCQMAAQDVEKTRKLAHLRIHVERVIGNCVMKYTILSSTVPINLALPCRGEDVTFLDKMVVVCCILTNLCPTVV